MTLSPTRKAIRKALRKYRVPLRPFLAQLRSNYPSKPHRCLPDHDYEVLNREIDKVVSHDQDHT